MQIPCLTDILHRLHQWRGQTGSTENEKPQFSGNFLMAWRHEWMLLWETLSLWLRWGRVPAYHIFLAWAAKLACLVSNRSSMSTRTLPSAEWSHHIMISGIFLGELRYFYSPKHPQKFYKNRININAGIMKASFFFFLKYAQTHLVHGGWTVSHIG